MARHTRALSYVSELVEATLDLTAFQSDGGTAKAWILPSGKAVMVPMQHYIWLDKNRERLKTEFGLVVPPINGMKDDQMSRLWALKSGLVRVNFKPSTGNLVVEINKTFWNQKTRDALVALVHKNASAIDYVTVNIVDDAGVMQPSSDSANLSMVDDDEKTSLIPVAAKYKRTQLVAAALKRFVVNK